MCHNFSANIFFRLFSIFIFIFFIDVGPLSFNSVRIDVFFERPEMLYVKIFEYSFYFENYFVFSKFLMLFKTRVIPIWLFNGKFCSHLNINPRECRARALKSS